MVYVDIKQSIPSMYSKNPKIFFDPETPESEKAAEIFELAVNIKWNQLKMKQKLRDVIKSAKFYGICATKTYFSFKEDSSDKRCWDDSEKNDEVRTDLVSLPNLLKDCSATSYATSSWIGHEVEDTVDNIAKKFRIKKKEEITVLRTAKGSSDIDNTQQKHFRYGKYIEIEDRANNQIFTIVTGINDRVFDHKEMDFGYDSMYDFLCYNDIPERADPKSDFDFWLPQLHEVARYRTILTNHAKKAIAKYKSVGKRLSDEQKSQLKSSVESSVLELDAGQDVIPFVHASIDPLLIQAEQAVRSDIQLISKQAPRQAPVKKTATEVKATEAAAIEVSNENIERLEEMMGSIAYKWAMLMKKNYSSTRILKLTDISDNRLTSLQDSLVDNIKLTDKNAFLVFTNQDLEGEVSAHIKAGSTVPDSDQTRMAKLQGFGQFIATNPAFQAQIDPEEILNEAIDVFDVRNDNLLKKKDNPVQESKLLNSGVFVSARMTEDHAKHLMIHERESNDNEQNILHILMHKEFKAQIEQNNQASMMGAMSQANPLNNIMSGQSFIGSQGEQPPASPLTGGGIPQPTKGIIPGGINE